MRISLNWLADYVDITGLPPETIAHALTNAGLEVESIERLGGAFNGVLVGRIDAVDPHPNADRLRLVTVSLGEKGQNQVVCGAPNVAVGQRIAYAQIGAQVVNRKEGGLFTLQAATIRGIASSGMICSIEELGLQDQFEAKEDGIWPITDRVTDAVLGQDLKIALNLQDDIVLDVAPTANRGDLMSMHGVAREVAALFERTLTFPDVPIIDPTQSNSPYTVALPDTTVCTFYTGGLLEGITLAQSPNWLRQRLIAAGMRPINNVVDVTNYVMLETGQPLHAFDIDRLGASGAVSVRAARPGETIDTLDGVTRALKADSVVVTFNDKPVALAGVMGGGQEEITDTTRRVFLEAAHFPSAGNRKSARSVGLRTESSARYERGVDAGHCDKAFYRAIQLLKEIAHASLQSITQCDHRQRESSPITLRAARMTRLLGLDIPASQVEAILTRLGFGIQSQPNQWQVDVPSFRDHDVTREIDVIEEVLRIYGYDHVPYTLPQGALAPIKTPRARLLETIRYTLSGAGLMEVTTLSLIGDDLLKRTGMTQDPQTTVRVTNSHSVDHTFLRQSLLPTLLDVAHTNQAQGNEAVWLFELGKTYFKHRPPQPKASGVDEPLMLGGVLLNAPAKGTWRHKPETDFYTLKGVVENLLASLGLDTGLRWIKADDQPAFHPGQTARLKLGKTPVGLLGRLHPALQDTLKFKAPLYLFELDVEALYAACNKPSTSKPVLPLLSAFPPVKRDIAFLAPPALTHGQVMTVFNQAQEPLLRQVELFDEYKNPQLGLDARSLAYRVTLQSPDATLTDDRIDATIHALKQRLVQELAVTLR